MQESFVLDLILVIIPILAVVLIGFVSVRFNYVNQAVVDALSRFVFTVAFPALLFRNLASADVTGNLDYIWRVLTGYYLGAVVVLVLGIVIAKFAFKMGQAEQNIFSVGSSHSNMIMLGVPATLIIFNAKWTLPLLLITGLHGIVMAILLTLVLRIRAGKAAELPSALWQAIVSQAKNPIFIALAAGVIYSVVGAPKLPGEINTILRILGNAVLPATLFALGGMMVRYSFGGHIPQAAAVSGLKLAAHPLIVWAIAGPLMGLNNWAWVAALLAAMPAGFNMHNMASRSKNGESMAATTIAMSTVLSVVAVLILLYLKQA